MNRQFTIGVLQINGTSETEPRRDALQTPLETFVITRPAEIKVWAREVGNMKRVDNAWYIERAAIKRSE